jgi:hypothetical protein
MPARNPKLSLARAIALLALRYAPDARSAAQELLHKAAALYREGGDAEQAAQCTAAARRLERAWRPRSRPGVPKTREEWEALRPGIGEYR